MAGLQEDCVTISQFVIQPDAMRGNQKIAGGDNLLDFAMMPD
jgi:hypothetical protein